MRIGEVSRSRETFMEDVAGASSGITYVAPPYVRNDTLATVCLYGCRSVRFDSSDVRG